MFPKFYFKIRKDKAFVEVKAKVKVNLPPQNHKTTFEIFI